MNEKNNDISLTKENHKENENDNNDIKTSGNTSKNNLKILVIGAGVLGSVMVHYLCKAGNDVTLCARSTYEELKENGIVIKHYAQRKTTVDHPRIIKEIDFSENYDIVFSVMQGQQQILLLDTFSKLKTKLIVLVGNNMEADRCETYINENKISKECHVLFGFQVSAGHREGSKVVTARLSKVSLYLGALHSFAGSEDLTLVKKAFNIKDYKIIEIEDMYSYYMYHAVEILPLVYLSYKYNNNLKKANSNDIKMVMEAFREGIELLKNNNLPPMPKGDDNYYYGFKGKFTYSLFRLICKTIIGNLTISDHCSNAVEEMKYIDQMFENYRKEHINKDMPTWDKMRKWAESTFN